MTGGDGFEFQPKMQDLTERLEAIVPTLREYMLETTKEAVERCIVSYETDVNYNDNYTFSTHVWRNLWNRYHEIALHPDTPISNSGRGNDYALKIKDIVFKHHRIDRRESIPKGAKAAKACADRVHYQTNFYWPELEDPGDQTNIILAIDAHPANGLKRMFLGKLVRESDATKSYFWSNVVIVYSSDELDKEFEIHDQVLVEPEAEPIVILRDDLEAEKKDHN